MREPPAPTAAYVVTVTRGAQHARAVADEVLRRIAADGGPAWRVLEVSAPDAARSSAVRHLQISPGGEGGMAEAVAVHFTVGVPPEEAVVATAGQIQDHAIEATQGSALPLCPGHRHPLHATLLAGRARWVCPADASHHCEPVVSGPAA